MDDRSGEILNVSQHGESILQPSQITPRERLIGGIDMIAVRRALASSILETKEEVLANIDHVQNASLEKIRDQLLTTYQGFLSAFTRPDGSVNEEAVGRLAEHLVSKIDMVTLGEFVDTAKKIVDERDPNDNDIVMYIPRDKRITGNLSLSTSKNSNEFMIKLVKKYADRKGKNVIIVSDGNDIRKYKKIIYADDMIFSGDHMSSNIGTLSEEVEEGTQVDMYCVAATQLGLETIKRTANPKMQLETHTRIIPSVYDAISDDTEARDFYMSFASRPALEHRASLSTIWEESIAYLKKKGTTISEIKTPDDQSFPSFLAAGIQGGSGRREYPTVDTVVIE